MHNLDSALINNLIFSVGISKLVLKLVFVSLVVISFFIDGSLAQTNAKNAELAAIIAKQKATVPINRPDGLMQVFSQR